MTAEPDSQLVAFGRRLRAARQNLGLSQEALARAVPVSKDTIQAWEGGRNFMRFDSMRALAGVLGISLTELVTWFRTDSEPPPAANPATPPPEPGHSP
jgi:transcriptional regulator with XRE-family HTH domain